MYGFVFGVVGRPPLAMSTRKCGSDLTHMDECNIELNPNEPWMDEIVFGDWAGSVVASKGLCTKVRGL